MDRVRQTSFHLFPFLVQAIRLEFLEQCSHAFKAYFLDSFHAWHLLDFHNSADKYTSILPFIERGNAQRRQVTFRSNRWTLDLKPRELRAALVRAGSTISCSLCLECLSNCAILGVFLMNWQLGLAVLFKLLYYYPS